MARDLSQEKARFEVKATAESHFSWLRTRLSTERTLMSWLRTGTALIGFGFTIFQVAERFHAAVAGLAGAPHHTPTLALTLLLAGIGAVAFVAVILRWP